MVIRFLKAASELIVAGLYEAGGSMRPGSQTPGTKAIPGSQTPATAVLKLLLAGFVLVPGIAPAANVADFIDFSLRNVRNQVTLPGRLYVPPEATSSVPPAWCLPSPRTRCPPTACPIAA